MHISKQWTATVVAGLALTGLGGAASATNAAGHRGPVECRASDVSASYHDDGAGLSHRYGRIVLRNISGRDCVVQGYGGLSYVGGGDGTQVGAAATRAPGRTPRTVLGAGDRVVGLVEATITAPYSRRDCRPVHVDGLRLYLPDETRALFVAHPTQGCANPQVHLLDHLAFGVRRR